MIKHRRLGLFMLACLLSGCAATPQAVFRTLTPESYTVGLTGPNLLNGPIYNTPPRGQSKPDGNHFGVIGITLSATYRLKPIKIERDDVQPVRIVRSAPSAGSSPSPRPTPTP